MKNKIVSKTDQQMYQWASELFPICRSLTGDGVRKTLMYLKELMPKLNIHEVASGTKVFDWTVPDEWNIKDAYVENDNKEKIIDFKKHNLHVMGYSAPIDQVITFAELDVHLHSLPDQPDAIPYVTSYYKRQWGFCITDILRKQLSKNPNAKYHVKIDATLEPGILNYGELIIPGKSEKEILLSTYICHPSMANNELSGPVVTAALARSIQDNTDRNYTYRILFLVETIGAITYLSQNYEKMKRDTIAGFVLTCVGDDQGYSYIASRAGNTLADRAAKLALKQLAPGYKSYDFLERGSDERQYCSPGIDLPVCSICRTKYGEFPEYHTSLDDMNFISPSGLGGAFSVYQKCIEFLENVQIYRNKNMCEPQLGKRGLYPSLSTKDTNTAVRDMMNFIAYADGTRDLKEIAQLINVSLEVLLPIKQKLLDAGVIEQL